MKQASRSLQRYQGRASRAACFSPANKKRGQFLMSLRGQIRASLDMQLMPAHVGKVKSLCLSQWQAFSRTLKEASTNLSFGDFNNHWVNNF